MIIGFIGTGGIAEAIVTGLFRCGGYQEPILVSRRNCSRSDRLRGSFPLVEVVDDNQTIIDRSDCIFVSVLPHHALELLPALSFRQDQRVVSLAAGIDLKTLAELVYPATRICRAVPMPPIEFALGPTPVYPPTAEVEELFSRVGESMSVENEQQLNALIASSAVMATFYEWVASNARWLESRGLPAEEAAFYITSVFHALAATTIKTDARGLQRMSAECLTPGGLNEQVLKGSRQTGLIEGMQAQIEGAMQRLGDAAQGYD